MYTILIVCLVILFIFLLLHFHIRLDLKSFLKKGFRAKRSLYGTYAFCGVQGSSKSLQIVKYCNKNKNDIFVFSNIIMTGLPHYESFTKFSEIYSFLERVDNGEFDDLQIVIVFDEIFTEMTKNSKLNNDIMAFLAQLRKRKIIFLTTCQSWAELPLSFRRLCRFEIDCSIFTLFRSYMIGVYRDAEHMKWDETEMDFVAPIVWTKIAKCNLCVANSYDTRQLIKNR